MKNFEGAWQMMNVLNGMRSPAVRDTAYAFATKLMEQCPEAERKNYVVLCLMDDIQGEFDFSLLPYMTVEHFISLVEDA